MRDPKRIDSIIENLKCIWKCFPDLRLGQLILNSISESELYYIEDKDFIKKIIFYYAEINKSK
jgi:hypothetical protein